MGHGISNNKIKHGDYVIVAIILLSALALFLGFAGRGNPASLTVSVDGVIIDRYTLPYYGEAQLTALDYPCTLVLDGYSARVTDSTCPGHDCEHIGTITRAGESIVCIPNRMIITLDGAATTDAVTG
jgi:hypothetical protein